MNKLFLTMMLALFTTIASAQFSVLTTVNKVEGINPVEPSMTEVYDGDACPTTDTDDSYNITDKIGLGYSYCLWKALYVEPYFTMPLSKDADGKREGELKLGVSYKF